MDIPEETANYRYERRVYYPPRLKRLMVALFCFAIGFASLLALLSGAAAQSDEGTYFLTGLFVFFVGSGGIIVFRSIRRKPVLVLDAQGLTVLAGTRRQQHVAWDRIADVHLFPAPPMQVLTITHRPAHGGWVDKAVFWRRGGPSHNFSRVAIPAVSVSTPLRKVEAEIRRRVPL